MKKSEKWKKLKLESTLKILQFISFATNKFKFIAK